MKFLSHLIFWVLLTLYACIIDPVHGNLYVQIVGTFLIIFNYIFVYYVGFFFVYPRYYRNKASMLLVLFLVFVVYHFISYFNFQYFLPNNGVVTSFAGQALWKVMISEIIIFGIVSTMSLGAYQRKIGLERMCVEVEKRSALLTKELGFLKNQFNSHITFNFLNYCYSRIHKDSLETGEAIQIFSKMLRYSLKSKVNEMVLLKSEMEYIEDFLKLQKLLTPEIYIEFLREEFPSHSIYIVPRVLITFIENAFKHGDLCSLENPLKINLKFVEGFLIFEVKNKKSMKTFIEISGIGQHNLKQQLELFYKGNYFLDTTDDGIIYTSVLKLTLN